jgi:hypothetical protein
MNDIDAGDEAFERQLRELRPAAVSGELLDRAQARLEERRRAYRPLAYAAAILLFIGSITFVTLIVEHVTPRARIHNAVAPPALPTMWTYRAASLGPPEQFDALLRRDGASLLRESALENAPARWSDTKEF